MPDPLSRPSDRSNQLTRGHARRLSCPNPRRLRTVPDTPAGRPQDLRKPALPGIRGQHVPRRRQERLRAGRREYVRIASGLMDGWGRLVSWLKLTDRQPPIPFPTHTAKFCQMQQCESAASFVVQDVSGVPTYQVRANDTPCHARTNPKRSPVPHPHISWATTRSRAPGPAGASPPSPASAPPSRSASTTRGYVRSVECV